MADHIPTYQSEMEVLRREIRKLWIALRAKENTGVPVESVAAYTVDDAGEYHLGSDAEILHLDTDETSRVTIDAVGNVAMANDLDVAGTVSLRSNGHSARLYDRVEPRTKFSAIFRDADIFYLYDSFSNNTPLTVTYHGIVSAIGQFSGFTMFDRDGSTDSSLIYRFGNTTNIYESPGGKNVVSVTDAGVLSSYGFKLTGSSRVGYLMVDSGSAVITTTGTFNNTVAADIAGCTTGSLALKTGDVVLLTAFTDIYVAAGAFIGELDVNGSVQTDQIIHNSTSRSTPGQQWRYVVGSDGNYTFKLLRRNTGANNYTLNAHTTLAWQVFTND